MTSLLNNLHHAQIKMFIIMTSLFNILHQRSRFERKKQITIKSHIWADFNLGYLKILWQGPRTPQFRILVTNNGTKLMFLEFSKNTQKWPFLKFRSISGVFAKTRAAWHPVTRFCSNLHQNFSFFMQFPDMPKTQKQALKNFGVVPLLMGSSLS